MNSLEDYLSAHDVNEMHPADIAKILKALDDENFSDAIKLVPKKFIGDIALALPERYFDDVVGNFSVEELSHAVGELESDDQVRFLQVLGEIDESIATEVFDSLHEDDRQEIKKLQKYEDTQAGAYMQLEIFTAKEDEIVQDVIKRFARLRKENEIENVQNLFITDEDDRLVYAVGLDDLLIFDFSKTIIDNINASDENFEPIKATDSEDIREVVRLFEEYDLGVLAIVNAYGILIGRVTSDDIYDIINEQATEQMYNLAGVDDTAEDDEDILYAGKKRAVWLSFNLVTALTSSLIIGLFANTLETMVALAVLMPIVASMGGNVGMQALTVVVRQLALGEISQGDAMRIIRKEVIIALINGAFFATIVGVVAAIWFEMGMLGIVIAMSMVINLFIAGFFGATIPLFLKRMDIDPAIGSSVILTAITDIVGFFSFLGLATYILL